MNKQYSDDLHSLSHTKWSCKYHIVFAPKYRRRAFYEARRVEVGAILRQLCEWKGVNIIEAEVWDTSALMIFDRHANLKYKYGNRHFWARGYYVDTVGKNTKRIKNYIANQLKEDQEREQLTLDLEYPFKKGKGKN